MSLPNWLTDKLANPPTAGDGLHGWLFSCARQLHEHMDEGAIEAILQTATANCGRRVPVREIRDAVRNSHAVRWVAKESQGREGKARNVRSTPSANSRVSAVDVSSGARPAPDRWPVPCSVRRRCRVADSVDTVAGLADLWETSPIRHEVQSADDWIDILFPDAEWLCLAVDHPSTARSRRRDKWAFGPAEECGFIVPSPMTGPSGKGLDGKVTHRCLDNTGPRRWLVIEWDKCDGRPVPIDEQASLHWHLRAACIGAGWPRLRLVLHSGGKSLHGWYGPVTSEESAKELMAYAVSLGADPAGWVRCQLMRLPGGVRARKGPDVELPEGWEAQGATVRQEVYFFENYTEPNL